MDITLLLSFIAASVALALMPGPDNILVLTESITRGKVYGIALALGLSSGVMVHTIAAATGLSLLVQASDLAYQLILYAGAAYLFYLGFMALKEQAISIKNESLDSTENWKKMIPKGFLMNVLNPKVTLFFVAFLPQFISPEGMNITIQMVILGAIFMIQAFLVFSAIAVMADKLSGYLKSPGFWKATKYIKAFILFGLGIYLVVG